MTVKSLTSSSVCVVKDFAFGLLTPVYQTFLERNFLRAYQDTMQRCFERFGLFFKEFWRFQNFDEYWFILPAEMHNKVSHFLGVRNGSIGVVLNTQNIRLFIIFHDSFFIFHIVISYLGKM